MTDETGPPPPRHPRRRRSDFDPTYIGPRVARERRRSTPRPTTARPRSPRGATPTSGARPDPGPGPAEVASAGSPVDGPVGAVRAGVAQAQDASTPGRPWLAVSTERALDPAICPFLRSDRGAGLESPVESPDAVNRCAALADPVPQSIRQQSLVCLTSGHVNCPRYLRGAAAVAPVTPKITARPSVSPAIAASAIAVLGAFVLSIGFVATRGGMELATVVPLAPTDPASGVAQVSPTPAVTAASTPEPTGGTGATTTAGPTAAASTLPTASSSPAPSPSPTATPTQASTQTPSTTPKPTAKSDRYAVLVACPDTPKCWIYTVRSGDNLYSIVRWFGVSEARVRAMNPWLAESGLRAGRKLRIPPPTR